MKFRRPWAKMALLLSLAAVVAIAVPVTLSYVFDNTEQVVNTFLPPEGLNNETAVKVDIVKTVINTVPEDVEGIGPDGFTFVLENMADGAKQQAVSDFQGKASFEIPYTGVDAGTHFCYNVYELNDGAENVTYSEIVYEIQVDIEMNDENKPVAKVKLDGKDTTSCTLKFENLYTIAEPPDTGDSSHVAVYAAVMVLCAAGMLLMVRKKKTAE
ncbi:MAG: hypothetical protein IJN44_12190 [Clostridia bacterium]|nr:hypothetical protein [Clostridia bacterium]